MTFEPQIPTWGDEYKSYTEKLKNYHDWLCTTGINTGLISRKSSQFIWDEFIVHSLYFGTILNNLLLKIFSGFALCLNKSIMAKNTLSL